MNASNKVPMSRMESQDVPFFMNKETANPKILYEWAFTLSVGNIMFCAFLIGRYPQYYGYWHVLKSIVLLGNRLMTYCRSKKQFYLLDFCYIGNYYSVVYFLLVVSGVLSETLVYKGFWVMFAFGAGPLAWSIFLLRNSLVMHSINKVTDLFIHASPALLAWAMRWSDEIGPIEIYVEGACAPTYWELFIIPTVAYLIWWLIYTAWMVTCGMKLVPQGYDLVYTLIMRTNPAARSVISPFGDVFGPIIYMLFHAAGCIVFFALSLIFWSSFWIHTCFLLLLLYLAVHNGATFYIKKVFKQDLLIYTLIEEQE